MEEFMPKTPDDMSAAAVKKRADISAESSAKAKAKAEEPPPPPKPRIAKKR
jgi:hypothetical protein